MTGEEFAARADAIAAELAARGVRPGERVAIRTEKGIDEAAAIFGCALAGGVSVVLNQRLRAAQVAYCVADCGARVVWPAEAEPAASDEAERERRRAAQELVPPPGAATIFYTSGSTGMPKGVVQTHDNLCDGAAIVAGYLGLTAADHLLGALPLSFDYGMNQLLSAAWCGAQITLLAPLSAFDLIDAVERGRCTGLAGVPTIWHELCRRLEPERLRSLRYVTNSGGRLAFADVRALRERLPWVMVFSMYGLTEAFRSAFLPPEEIDRLPESFGKAIPGVELRVVDPESGRECAVGEVGELVHAGKLVAAGYWNRPADTARVFRPHPSDPARGLAVWSGDFVRRDAEGFLHFVGRRDRMLKVHGHRASPDEFEAALRAVDGVEQAAVFGVPDPALGDRVIACVSGAVGGEQVLAELRRTQPSFLVPAEVRVFTALPLNQNGKIDVEALRRGGVS